MKAISLWQPWASLVAHGHKKVETRSWAYRGGLPAVLAVHATRAVPDAVVGLVALDAAGEPFRRALEESGYGPPRAFHQMDVLPYGKVVALARLAACVGTDRLLSGLAWPGVLTDKERAFGDYAPGRYGWLFDRVRRLETPAPARGSQGVWRWEAPPELEETGRAWAEELLTPRLEGRP